MTDIQLISLILGFILSIVIIVTIHDVFLIVKGLWYKRKVDKGEYEMYQTGFIFLYPERTYIIPCKLGEMSKRYSNEDGFVIEIKVHPKKSNSLLDTRTVQIQDLPKLYKFRKIKK